MSTEQRRYQVFVSSTYLDLRPERQAVTSALLEADAFPAGMELFPATDDDAWTLIKKVIDESDYYLLIIGGKYGSVEEASGLSYTEKEFDYAVATNKPVMAFLHGEPEKLTFENSEKTEELQAKIAAFRKKVQSSKHVKFWTSSDQLAGQVALTYNKFTRLYPAVGWIRADRATSAESLQAIADARARIDELEQQLARVRTSAPEGAAELAQGSDKVSVPIWTKGWYSKPGGGSAIVSQWISQKTTWDALFAAVSPRLLQECEETALHKLINEFVRHEFLEELAEALAEKAKPAQEGSEPPEIHTLEAEIADDDFGTMLIQLMALGLIRRSDKKRSVTDTGTYWTLTPYGETRAIQLRALKRLSKTESAMETSSLSTQPSGDDSDKLAYAERDDSDKLA